MLWFKKKKKGQPGHRTNFQKSIDQNQSFFFPGLYFLLKYAIGNNHSLQLIKISFETNYIDQYHRIIEDARFGLPIIYVLS